MEKIGKMNVTPGEFVIEWIIENFLSLSTDDDKCYTSPLFSFASAEWYLKIYPNGKKKQNSVGYIDLYLYKKPSGISIVLEYSMCLKTLDENVQTMRQYRHVFEKANIGYGSICLLKRSKVVEKMSEVTNLDILAVICKLKYPRPFKVTTNEKLLNDLEAMMLSGDHSDTTIKVKAVDFRLHRNILGARNAVFNTMFKNEMREKITGIVSINDCEPDIFRSFIHFVYTGKIDELSFENVCDLYNVAHKYQEDQLKAKCLQFMINNISVDSVSDFAALAIRYEEKKLLKIVTDFFSVEATKIIRSVKWQTFLAEYPAQGNELYIKALDHMVHK